MRIAEYKQIDTNTVTEEVVIPATYDEEGNEVTPEHTEVVTKEVPVMGTVYRDMTPEEEAEALAQQAEAEEYERTRPRTADERLDAYAEDTDAALFDLDAAQNDYAAETDAALFDLVDYIATLEARIESLEAVNG